MKHKIMVGIFLAFIFGGAALNLLTPDQAVSESENRPLKQKPKFSVDELLSGEYMSEFETYVTDQFFAKDWWVGVKSDMERLFLKQENNGVYFGKDGYLLETLTEEGRYFHRNLAYLNVFQEKVPQIQTTALLVPTAVEIYRDKLPLFAPVIDQAALLETAKEQLMMEVVDPLPVLKEHRSEYLYYKTDHHWTVLGAMYTYQELMKRWEMDAETEFETEVVSTDFYGTYYSKANNRQLPPDQIILYHPTNHLTFTTEINGEVMEGLYDWSYLGKKDQYSMFLGGNQPLTIVRSEVQNGKKLAIFKDSYAHSFAPFLASHFEEIHLIDLRYFNLNPYDYLQEVGIEKVLFLYNLSTFGTEASLSKLNAFRPTLIEEK